MRIPALRGIIDRRILANFNIDPEVMARALPAPFRPKLYGGKAIGGICLIRLKAVRPRWWPLSLGLGSENAAHRIAVEWGEEDSEEGVFVPRRDTDSWLNHLAGGRAFPGVQHRANFRVDESEERLRVDMKSVDGQARVRVSGKISDQLPETSVFPTLAEASTFFEGGALGYSATRTEGRYDGIELACDRWEVEALDVDEVVSSYFDDETLFPRGSVAFDCALLMRNIRHSWHGREDLCCPTGEAALSA